MVIDWDFVGSSSVAIIIALIAGFVALHQVKSNVISAARIKWIEEFKQNISEFLVNVSLSVFHFQNHLENKDQDSLDLSHHNLYLKCHQILMTRRSLIVLSLNLSEKRHKEIYDTLVGMSAIVVGGDMTDFTKETELKLNALNIQLIEQTNKMLKIEWEKSKKMFYVKWFDKKK